MILTSSRIEGKPYFAMTFLAAMFLCFAATGLPQEDDKPSNKDRCPVCGMYVDRHPHWIARIVLKDGRRVFFDGPKDMFRYYLNMSQYEKSATLEDISEIYVADYYSTKPIKASEAFFVVGSDVKGPMGKELVPLGNKAEAETFLKDHQGEKILEFDEVTSSVLPGLQ